MVRGVPRGRDAPVPAEAVLRDWPALAVVLAGLATAISLRGPLGESNAQRRRNDFRWTPDADLIGVLAGAHKSTTADLLWLRTLPDLSREFSDPKLKARWVHHSLDAITDLEPTFGTVYEFGEAYLSILARADPGSLDRAIALLEKGRDANPDSAGFEVRIAMIHFEKKDRAKTLEHLIAASKLDGFDGLSQSMLAAMLAGERDDLVALGLWDDARASGNPEVKRRAELEFWRTKSEIARRAGRDFEKRTGRKPSVPADVADPELVQPAVVEVIRDGLVIDEKGMPRYPRAAELEIEDIRRSAESWARQVRDETGDWPTQERFAEFLGRPPAGKRWLAEGDRVTLVPAE